MQHAWQALHPPVQPHDRGWLDRGNGHRLYWEVCGHPLAPAALVVHGGPGAGCSERDRRWFDPQRWRVVLVDQRGCGRSTPPGGLVDNDTAHGVADLEALRHHLGIARWTLLGGSWGATLALCYAQQHPERVQALVLRSVFLATAREQAWLYGDGAYPPGAAALAPQAWQRLTRDARGDNAQAVASGGAPLLQALALRLAGSGDDRDTSAQAEAATAWWGWERALMDPVVSESPRPSPELSDIPGARVGVHFARHRHFVAEGQLLLGMRRLQGVPGWIVHGREDQVTPLESARALHQVWPESVLQVVEGAGHATDHPALAAGVVQACDDAARLCSA